MSRTYKEHHPTAHNPKNRIPTPYLDKEGKVEDMYLENGDEVIEADNGKLILANSGAYCDENGNPTGGCIDYEDTDVYVTKTGSVYHTSKDCPSLKARNPEVKKISLSDARKQGYKACKRCRKN